MFATSRKIALLAASFALAAVSGVGATPAQAQPASQATVDSLRAEVAQLLAWKTAIDGELGPVVDPGAQTIRARIRELGVAFNGVVARMEGIPGDTRIVDVLREQYSPILTRLPPANRTVVEYVASAIVAAGTGSGPPGPPGPPGGSGVSTIPGLGNGIAFTSSASGPNADMPGGVPSITHLIYAGAGGSSTTSGLMRQPRGRAMRSPGSSRNEWTSSAAVSRWGTSSHRSTDPGTRSRVWQSR